MSLRGQEAGLRQSLHIYWLVKEVQAWRESARMCKFASGLCPHPHVLPPRMANDTTTRVDVSQMRTQASRQSRSVSPSEVSCQSLAMALTVNRG